MRHALIEAAAAILILSPEAGAETTAHTVRTQLEENFAAAREHFGKRENSAAAHHIEYAARTLDSDTERAWGDGKRSLETAVRELENVAWQVETGTVRRAVDLDRAFAQAIYAHHKETRFAKGHYVRKNVQEKECQLVQTV